MCYQSSLQMAPFEVLYGRKCWTPLNWSETGERPLFGPDMFNEAEEKVRIIRENLKIAQSRQKSYYDKHHQEVHYEIGDKAYLRVSPLRDIRRFGIKGKLAPRYVGPFTVLAKRGDLSYQLEFPQTSRMYMMCFMFPNSGDASRIQSVGLIMRCWTFKRI